MTPLFKKIPWDTQALKTPVFEITSYDSQTLQKASEKPGHYVLKIPPLTSKKLCLQHAFYYCDTLITPFCKKSNFKAFDHKDVSLKKTFPLKEALRIATKEFSYDHFHRDFNVSKSATDQRYHAWLKKLHQQRKVLGLFVKKDFAGFFAYEKNTILLHALGKKFRGKKLAKYFWSAACEKIFQEGRKCLESSISTSNIPALNLYASLGFKFRDPVDIYHKVTLPARR